ncbi:MAG: hypothetical protein JWQ71_936 [Pedosphaera sp.]|nr:hypothetical protein [Pedosphaera sp.]
MTKHANILPQHIIYLSKEEKSWHSQIYEIVGQEIPFWLIGNIGESSRTDQVWNCVQYQKVINHFLGKIQFVQVGDLKNNAPALKGVIDLRGKTDKSQLIRLIYHSSGVLSPATALTGLAAAVEVKPGSLKSRPCIVVEPIRLKAYPQMITPEVVIKRIERFFAGNPLKYLRSIQVRHLRKIIAFWEKCRWDSELLEQARMAKASTNFLKNVPSYPGGYKGRGLVICAGGVKYFANAWICIGMLRKLGCSLPIQVWHFGKGELDDRMARLLEEYNVECVDAQKLVCGTEAEGLQGWPLKPYAILHCPYKQVLLLDADNMSVVNPEFLFETREFNKSGAVFWPDYGRLDKQREIWKVCEVPYRDEPEFESGQVLIDKEKCWQALNLTMWYNLNAEFYYRFMHGDKETFHMAFRKANKSYAMPGTPIESLAGTMCQHDFNGRRIFQHRNWAKWNFYGSNESIKGFLYENECFQLLDELKGKWDGIISGSARSAPQNKAGTGSKRIVRQLNTKNSSVTEGRGNDVVFRAVVNTYTGYGLHTFQIIRDFMRQKYRLHIRATEFDEQFSPVPSWIKNKIIPRKQMYEWELLLHPPNIPVTKGKKTVYFTMWESSRLPRPWVEYLNGAECIIVPSQWNASCFSASGVDRPIRIIPLGINTDVFRYSPVNLNGPCVFGIAARMAHGGVRKGVNEVIHAFQKAFPSELDVRLSIKAFPDCKVNHVADPRIHIIRQFLPERTMGQWFKKITCFVSASKAEGWGLLQHQALASGRPLISVQYGGVAEFFRPEMGYPLDFKIVPASNLYTGCGDWAEPDEESLIQNMRAVFKNRDEAKLKGHKGALAVQSLTWKKSNQALKKVLQEVGMIK